MTRLGYCDKSLSYYQRAKHLTDSLTLAEKAQLLGSLNKGAPRVGIPEYNWWSEALHGVSNVGDGSKFGKIVPAATSFPTPITTTSSFNESLWKAIGQAVSTEARAMNNLGVAGLTFWSPNINVVRDPRWGRTLETPGEDPYVAGRYAVNYVRGLQDVEGQETAQDPNTRPLKVSACCKHYAAYDLDKWTDKGNMLIDRFRFSANATEQDMVETFLRPFEMCVKDGDVSSVMCSYNNIWGIPTCADARLLRGTIRGDWNLHGYIVSDCDSIQTIVESQKFLDDTPYDGVAQVLKAGLDMDCQSYYQKYLESASLQGLVKESDMDSALINDFIVLMRLGWFDGQPAYDSLNAKDICSKEHLDLAADAARKGIVLLKNVNSALPLSTDKHKNIAIVGPHANATSVMIGNYAGVPCKLVSPFDGLKAYANVTYQMGCADVLCKNETFIFPAVRVARDADATIIAIGLDLDVESEGLDRLDLDLPGSQNMLVRQVAQASKGPVVLLILSAGGVNVTEFHNSNDIDAIVWAGYPGEQGGAAIADVLYGKHNPGGRLPVTWYPGDYVSQLPMTSMNLRPIDELDYPGRTYKFYNGSTIYQFGYGLSYTQFTYAVTSTQKGLSKKLQFNQHCVQLSYNHSAYIPPCHGARISDLACNQEDITIDVSVTNTGKVDGTETVILFSRPPQGLDDAPIKQVIGFQSVFVAAGATEVVTFKLISCNTLSIVTGSAYVALPAGQHTIVVGTGDNSIEFPFQVSIKK
ncbi:probable beta-D-xylosidase 2 [Phoenix dactylifera]|uniref:Probable beta-D-xylosidase 2 n=1 Tax=Phoenix dactylifera TaxID=42345 RepID=A0A8B7CZY4_PHODC|nr:probable beta-D-xylosidase 2 [Phoenix dactylifera]